MLRPAFYLASVTMLFGVAALMLLPATLAAVPAVLLGFGLGIFPLVMVMISRSGRTTAETTAMSTLAQSVGYLLATAGLGFASVALNLLGVVVLVALAFGYAGTTWGVDRRLVGKTPHWLQGLLHYDYREF